jgi:hypothetical protein
LTAWQDTGFDRFVDIDTRISPTPLGTSVSLVELTASIVSTSGGLVGSPPTGGILLVAGGVRLLTAGALAVRTPWPAAGPALALLQLFLRPAYAAVSSGFLLGLFDPADELVAGQGGDVPPGVECRRVGDQRLAQVTRQPVDDSARDARGAHTVTVVGDRGSPRPVVRGVGTTGLWYGTEHRIDARPPRGRLEVDRVPAQHGASTVGCRMGG